MTDIEIEKLADAIVRKLPPTVSIDIQDKIEEVLTEKLGFVMRRLLTKVGEAINNAGEDI